MQCASNHFFELQKALNYAICLHKNTVDNGKSTKKEKNWRKVAVQN